MTLIEAVVGTALLGTVLVAVLMANSRLTAQDGVSGPVGGHGGWTWRTRVVESASAEKIDAEVVALEIFAPPDRSRLPLARVEILLHKDGKDGRDEKDETDRFDRPDLD